jgi:hypothetical protein
MAQTVNRWPFTFGIPSSIPDQSMWNVRPTHWHWNKPCSEDFDLTTKAPYRSSYTHSSYQKDKGAKPGNLLSNLVVAECFTRPPLAWILPSPLTEMPNFPHVYPVRAAKWLIHFTTYWSLCSYVYCGPASPSCSRPLTWFLYQLDSLVWCSGEDQCKWKLMYVAVITVILFWRKLFYVVCRRSITETHTRSINKSETFPYSCFIIRWNI